MGYCIVFIDWIMCLNDRVRGPQSLVNAHLFKPECVPSTLPDPPLCSCGDSKIDVCDNGTPTIPGPVLTVKSYTTRWTFECIPVARCVPAYVLTTKMCIFSAMGWCDCNATAVQEFWFLQFYGTSLSGVTRNVNKSLIFVLVFFFLFPLLFSFIFLLF